MPVFGVIEIAFDPVVYVGQLGIRWQTIGATLAVLAAVTVAAATASHLPAVRRPAADDSLSPVRPYAGAPAAGDRPAADRLRLDDLAYIVLGSVPGAVVGGRLAHGMAYWDAYAADPWRLLDPALGSLSLLGAVVGGMLTSAYICLLLGAPLRRWVDAAAVPMLIAVGLGKLAQLLGGSGQGAPFDGPWAVAFTGPGPWLALEPAVPAHPAQVYEGLWALVGVFLLLRLAGPGRDLGRALHRRLRWLGGPVRRTGLLFWSALGWFLLGRVVVGFSWRDEALAGPLNAEQAMALGLLGIVALGAVLRTARGLTGRPRRR